MKRPFASRPVSADEPCELEWVPCCVCGEDDPRASMAVEERFLGIGGDFVLNRCGGCGHIYLSPRPTPQALGRYYPAKGYGPYEAGEPKPQTGARARVMRAALEDHFGYPATSGSSPGSKTQGPKSWMRKVLTFPAAVYLRHSRHHVNVLPWAGQGRLLDFGCGGGEFLDDQRQRGWSVAGIDMSESVVHRIVERGIDARVGFTLDDAFGDERFDVITGWHVIEHMPDPVGFLRDAVERLNPGGYLQIACPDAGGWGFGLFGKYWLGADPPRHFSIFARHQLADLMHQAGLEIERYRPHPRSGVLRQSARLRAQATDSAFWHWLARRRTLASFTARLAVCFGRADIMILRGRKPLPAHGLAR